jgi:undecaprenyl-diphosphatase
MGTDGDRTNHPARPLGRRRIATGRVPWPTALAIGLLLTAALALSLLSARGLPFAWDVPVMARVQSEPAWTIRLAQGLSWIGLFVPSLLLALAVAAWIWRIGARAPAALVVAASLLHGINVPMKLAIGRGGPPDDLAEIIERASGLGFPSGHAFGAMLLFPVIAVALGLVIRPGWPLRIVQALLVLLAVGIGWSRVRLGAHWPSDVLGGWLWGAGIALALLAWGERWGMAMRPGTRRASIDARRAAES